MSYFKSYNQSFTRGTKMAQTVYSETEKGEVIALIGKNRSYAVGDTAYSFKRQDPGFTLPLYAIGRPVAFIDGRFQRIQGNTILKSWQDEITPIATYY